MESKTIKIGTREFKSKKSLQEACKIILNSTQVGNKLEGEYFDIIDFVFRMHPRYEEKVKGMVYTIHKRPARLNPKNNEFYIIRENGTSVDFSYISCFKKPDTAMQTIKKQLRWVIREQMQQYKGEYFRNRAIKTNDQLLVRCQMSGDLISIEQVHLDHSPVPFNTIMNDWLEKTGYTEQDLALGFDPEATYSWGFLNKEIEKEWQEYHLHHAKYLIVLDKLNMSKGKNVIETDAEMTEHQLYCKSLLKNLFKKYEG